MKQPKHEDQERDIMEGIEKALKTYHMLNNGFISKKKTQKKPKGQFSKQSSGQS